MSQPTVPSPAVRREIDLLAVICVLLCVTLAWAGRTALNPDGVSYLDMAERMAAGDWAAAAQGYWSPLYSMLLAAVTAVSGARGAQLLSLVHATNAAIAIGGIALLWRLARAHGDAVFARGLFAAFLLCSARTPRLDAVTPDLLLLAMVVGIGMELLQHDGRRWLPLGLWMGMAYLAKTSSWPWLLVSVMALLLLGHPARRLAVLRASAVAAALMLLWVVPMSLQARTFTLGSAGRLNACWYLERCDSRTPDTHAGSHTRLGALTLGDGEAVAIADYTGTPWTYLPWSDPTAWEAGVVTRARAPMDLADLAGYWWRQFWVVLTLWTPHLLLGVLAPLAWIAWRPNLLADGWRDRRAALIAILLGVIGVGQFVAVHAEPRLIAPFVLLASMGVLWWLRPPGAAAGGRSIPAGWLLFLTWIGFATAVPRGLNHVRNLSARATADVARLANLAEAAERGVPGGLAGRQIVVIGPAIPVVSDAWYFGSRIVAQVPPASADRVRTWTPAKQRELLAALGQGPGEVAWLSNADGSFQMAPIPRSAR
jgi:hypothetical protein